MPTAKDTAGIKYVVVGLPQDLLDAVEYLRRYERPNGRPRKRTQVIRDLMHLGLEAHRKIKSTPAEAST